ncbi:MAG: hypothetical protein RL596_787 [Bacteroidota bacterium]
MTTRSYNQKVITMIRILVISAIVAIILASCSKRIEQDASFIATTAKIAPDGFLFNSSRTIHFTIHVQSVAGHSLTGVPIAIYQYKNEQIGKEIFRGFSGNNGIVTGTFQLTQLVDSVVIDPAYIGLVRNAIAVINNNSINCTIGGTHVYSGSIIGAVKTDQATNTSSETIRSNDINGVFTNTIFSYLSKYDADGRPTALSTSDIITDEMLAAINAALPEVTDLRKSNPQFLTNTATSNIVVTKDAEVWITFVSEGAGYRNSVGFYSYPTNAPPKSLADIKQISFAFPNTSFKGSNGSMISGDKISLGKFTGGTTIGMVLFANGWNGKEVNIRNTAYFTDYALNPEKTPELQRHSVLLKYKDTYMIAFEDLDRSSSGCDQDFNDLVIYASANPINNISNDGVISIDPPKDTDGDGVTDNVDQFPTDRARAFINYYPAKESWSTIAFEDNWPVAGDYDLNDVVINYNYAWVTNASNNVVEMFANFQPLANGASFQNGFGIQFPFSSSAVSSVTGGSTTANYINFNSNGTEAGQSNAVIIPFDNMRSILNNTNGAFFVNTDMALPRVNGTQVNMKITFTSPIAIANFTSVPFNPFIISDLRRGYEIHLPGQIPTSLADKTLLGQGIDATNITTGVYYVTKQNYPWAINFTTPFVYPIERSSIADAYPYFLKWAASSGTQYADWFLNTGTGYRNTNLLYTK